MGACEGEPMPRASSCVFLALLAASVACSSESSSRATVVESAGSETPAAEPESEQGELIPPSAQPQPSPCSAEGHPPANPATVDPAAIEGYVSGRQAPRGEGRGVVGTIRMTPNANVNTVWELRFCVGVEGEAREFLVYVPRGFPVPFSEGQEIAYVAGGTGGGPNYRATILVRDASGALLFAVGAAPDELQVERGRRVRGEPASGYRESVHEVVFTPDGAAATRVAPGTWARITTPSGDYLLWGDSHVRRLRRGQPAPPDFVESWTDFAIVGIP